MEVSAAEKIEDLNSQLRDGTIGPHKVARPPFPRVLQAYPIRDRHPCGSLTRNSARRGPTSKANLRWAMTVGADGSTGRTACVPQARSMPTEQDRWSGPLTPLLRPNPNRFHSAFDWRCKRLTPCLGACSCHGWFLLGIGSASSIVCWHVCVRFTIRRY